MTERYSAQMSHRTQSVGFRHGVMDPEVAERGTLSFSATGAVSGIPSGTESGYNCRAIPSDYGRGGRMSLSCLASLLEAQ